MKKIIPIMFLMMLVFSSFGVFSLSIIEGTDEGIHYTSGRSIVVNSTGGLHVVYIESNETLWYENSIDNGVTWSNRYMLCNRVTHNTTSLVIDSNDNLMVAYTDYNAAVWDDTYYRRSTDNGVTWLANATLFAQAGTHWLACYDPSLTVDNDDDIMVAGAGAGGPANDGTVHYRRYSTNTGTWSPECVDLYYQNFIYSVDIVALENDTGFSVFLTSENSVPNTFHSLWYAMYLTTNNATTEQVIYDAADAQHEVTGHSTCVDLNNDVHIVYTRENGANDQIGIYYVMYDTSVGTFSAEETVFYNEYYPAYGCSISYTFDGDIEILWGGTCPTATNRKIMRSTSSGGSWSNPEPINSGTDNVEYHPDSVYQRYPDTCILMDGISFIYYNDTNNNICHYNTDIPTWFSGSGDIINTTFPTCSNHQIGSLGDNFNSFGGNQRYIYTVYNNYEQLTIDSLQLRITFDMYNGTTDASNYYMKIGNSTAIMASGIQMYGTDFYVLTWEGLSISIDGNIPIIFYATEAFSSDPSYWGLYKSNNDLWFDGSNRIFTFNDPNFWNDFIFFGGHSWPSEDISIIYEDNLVCRMCITRESSEGTLFKGYDNFIDAYPATLSTYSPLTITYTFNDTALLSSEKFVYIDIGGTIVNKREIYQQSDYFIYSPTTTGTGYVNLSINNINVSYDTFTVSGTLNDYVYTVPNPSLPYGNFVIFYNYSNADYNGKISLYTIDGVLLWETLIMSSSNGYTTPNINLEEGTYKIKLFCNYLNYSYQEIYSYFHNVKSSRLNSILCDKYNIELGDSVRLEGSHDHVGQYVVIKVGSDYIFNVGNSGTINYQYFPPESGTFTVKLVLILASGEIILCTAPQQLIVTAPLSESMEEGIVDLIRNNIDATTRHIIGLLLTVIITLLPFLATLKMKQSGHGINVQVPNILYGIMFGVGTVSAYIIGLIDSIVLFFLLITLISIVALIFYSGKSTSNNEE